MQNLLERGISFQVVGILFFVLIYVISWIALFLWAEGDPRNHITNSHEQAHRNPKQSLDALLPWNIQCASKSQIAACFFTRLLLNQKIGDAEALHGCLVDCSV
jgi:hypothetical protein